MNSAQLLVEAFGRIKQHVHRAVNELSADELAYRADDGANSVAWLIWHLTRVQDDHVSELAGREQRWSRWAERFELPFDTRATGYGQSSDDVAAVKPDSPKLLTGYYDDVHQATVEFVATLEDGDLDRIVDTSWDPPVTLGVRLVSVIDDDIQHAGQALFVRGLVERLR